MLEYEQELNQDLRKHALNKILKGAEILCDSLEFFEDPDLEFETKTEKQIKRIINVLNNIDTHYCRKFKL